MSLFFFSFVFFFSAMGAARAACRRAWEGKKPKPLDALSLSTHCPNRLTVQMAALSKCPHYPNGRTIQMAALSKRPDSCTAATRLECVAHNMFSIIWSLYSNRFHSKQLVAGTENENYTCLILGLLFEMKAEHRKCLNAWIWKSKPSYCLEAVEV